MKRFKLLATLAFLLPFSVHALEPLTVEFKDGDFSVPVTLHKTMDMQRDIIEAHQILLQSQLALLTLLQNNLNKEITKND